MIQGSPLLPIFGNSRAASSVIPLLPKATFTPSVQPNLGLPRTCSPLTSPPSTPFWPYGTHPFSPRAQTISVLSDPLYSPTPVLYQVSYTPILFVIKLTARIIRWHLLRDKASTTEFPHNLCLHRWTRRSPGYRRSRR